MRRHVIHPAMFNFKPGILQSHLQLPGKLTINIQFQSQQHYLNGRTWIAFALSIVCFRRFSFSETCAAADVDETIMFDIVSF